VLDLILVVNIKRGNKSNHFVVYRKCGWASISIMLIEIEAYLCKDNTMRGKELIKYLRANEVVDKSNTT
jgi:hypothetical protein